MLQELLTIQIVWMAYWDIEVKKLILYLFAKIKGQLLYYTVLRELS